MSLPVPPVAYSPNEQGQVRAQLDRMDGLNRKKGQGCRDCRQGAVDRDRCGDGGAGCCCGGVGGGDVDRVAVRFAGRFVRRLAQI